jgi:acyl-CoA reductase-like NAD-dependent aldehyde dehydrogenase
MKKIMLSLNCILSLHKTFLLVIALAAFANVFGMNEKDSKKLLQGLVYSKAKELSKKITEKAESLKTILSDYQTHDVTCYEIERSVRTLAGLHENGMYLGTGEKIDSAAIMLPSNLPLYSLVLFGLIPSFMAKSVAVRPNSLLQEHDIVTRIYNDLGLESLFPDVQIVNTDHSGFLKYMKEASLVVFTGKPANAENLIKEMKNNSILVVNGSGHNPVVVTDSADIDKAVAGAVLLKGFNGGQDCAGPDAILVHQDVAQEFTEKFHKKFSSLKTGQFKDSETIIGPINRFTELQKFAGILYNNRKDVISGGAIDFKNNIVSPTTIVRGVERYPNYQEMFGPIAFINPYKKDEDLSYYFQDSDGQYQAHRMYVTVYGHSDYISSRDDNKIKLFMMLRLDTNHMAAIV